jgi:N-methylhydantoinase A
MLRIGVDIGGTFTDITIADDESAEVFHLKTLTSAHEPVEAVLEALGRAGIDLTRVSFLSHGTTLAINAIIQRTGARTGVITTEGFEDILELRRGARTHLADPLMDKPYCFVSGRHRLGTKERIAWDGSLVEPLDEEHLVRVIKRLRDQGIESVAMCFLNSYANPVHERRAGEICKSKFPNMFYTLSTDIVAEVGEYERTSTAVLNAYLHPVVHRHLLYMEQRLQEQGLPCQVHIMRSNGGVMTARAAAHHPIFMLESGPAAGTMAAAYMGELIGIRSLITFDMGGTTSKAAVVENGTPLATVVFELSEEAHRPGSGWPIRVPMIDVVETGAGGGSIAWLDEAGNLQVGPRSAGADPGPVCYNRGGVEPTLTDANAVLGRLESLVGGTFPLNIEKARIAVQERIATPLGLSLDDAAAGIIEIADAKAADALRMVTIAQGRDPRDFTLMTYGGAGPLEAAYLLDQLELAQAVVPSQPGNFSAFGLLCTDLVHDAVRTYVCALKDVDVKRMVSLYAEMQDTMCRRLREQGMSEEHIKLFPTVDLRYRGQFHIVSVPLHLESDEALADVEDTFHAEHMRLYTFRSPDEPIELVNLRLRAVGAVRRPNVPRVPKGSGAAARRTRPVYFRELGRRLPTPIYERSELGEGTVIEGPAILEELTSTTLVPARFAATIDQYGNLILRKGDR